MNEAPRALRDRLVAALSSEAAGRGRATIVRLTDDDAELLFPSGARVVLLLAGDGQEAAEAVRERAHTLVKERGATYLMVVAVGGGDAVAAALKSVKTWWQGRWPYSLHHIDDASTYARLTGGKSPALERAAATALAMESVTADELGKLRDEAARSEAQERRFAAHVSAAPPVVTLGIIAVCVLVFLLSSYWGRDGYAQALFRMGASFHGALAQAGWYRLLAPAFLHWSFIHLALNMYALFAFGPFLEGLLGRRRHVVLYTLAALGAGAASELGPTQGLSAGASGAIWGLMTAGAGLAIRPRGLVPPQTLARLRRQITYPIVMNLLYSFRPGIDIFAHLGGGAVGLVLLVSGVLTRGISPRWAGGEGTDAPSQPIVPRSVALTYAAWGCAAALAVSVAAAWIAGRPWDLVREPVWARAPLGDSGLEAELPSTLEPFRETPGDTPGSRDLRSGTLDRGPFEIVVAVIAMPESIGIGDDRTILEDLQRTAGPTLARQGKEVREKFSLVDASGSLAVRGTFLVDKSVECRSTFLARGTRLIRVDIIALTPVPVRRKAAIDRVSGSIRWAPPLR